MLHLPLPLQQLTEQPLLVHIPTQLLFSGGSDKYYACTFSFVANTFNVTKATLTATADAKTKVYGTANPALTFQYSGWQNGNGIADLTTAPTASTTVTVTSPVAVYTGAITVSGGVDENYSFSYVAANFPVTKATLIVTADAKTKVYGAANPALTFQYSGWVNGNGIADLTTAPTASTTVTVTSPVAVYTGAITVSGGVDENYSFSYVAANFPVTKATLTATADAKTKVYGEANPTLTFQYSGWVNGVEAIDVAPSIITTLDGTTIVGTYADAITLSGGSDNNYTFSLVSGDLEVTKAVLTATADNQTKVYGEANPTLTFQYSGWINGVEAIDAAPSITTAVDGTTVVGSYSNSITLSGGSDNNYTFSFVAGTFNVTKATLTVTADAKTKVSGEANPALTFQYSGWLNGDDAEDLTTKPSASTTVSVTSPVDVYTGGITVAGGVDENYNFSYNAADFSVTKATLTVTADAKTKVYGEANPSLTFQYSGWVNGVEAIDDAPSITTTVDGTTIVGTYTDAITLSGGSDNNYTFNLVAGALDVTKAVLTATAEPKTKVYGEANPLLTFLYSGWVNGVETIDVAPSITTTVDGTTIVGTYTDAITLSGGLDNNYTFSFVAGALDVTKAILTATAEPKDKGLWF